jgi:hypothetical protein
MSAMGSLWESGQDEFIQQSLLLFHLLLYATTTVYADRLTNNQGEKGFVSIHTEQRRCL